MRDVGEQAFVALEVQHDYAEAARLYDKASRAHPDALEYVEGLREAERRRELAERRALYEQVYLDGKPRSAGRILAASYSGDRRSLCGGLCGLTNSINQTAFKFFF